MHIDPKASFREMKMGFAVVGSVFVVLAILRIVSTLTNAINISTNARQRLHPVSSSQWPRSDSSHGARTYFLY